MYTLYGRGESGNAYKAALMLSLTGVAWRPHFVPFFTPDTKAAFRDTLNEMGELPVLEGEGIRLSQSGVILTYLADITGRFGGRDAAERLEILRWMLFDNHRFSSFYATLRMLVGLRGESETPVTGFLRTQATAAFATLEAHLDGRDYVVGDRLTIADVSLAGYMFFDEETGIDRADYPAIARWTRRIAETPGWAHPYALMPRAMGRDG